MLISRSLNSINRQRRLDLCNFPHRRPWNHHPHYSRLAQAARFHGGGVRHFYVGNRIGHLVRDIEDEGEFKCPLEPATQQCAESAPARGMLFSRTFNSWKKTLT